MGNITVDYKGDMIFSTNLGKHDVTFAVPSMGAEDIAPNPTQMALASIAACAGVFAAQYCNNAGLDASGMKVSMDFESKDGYYTNFVIKVELPNVTDEKRVAAIKRAAEHCTVHETIRNFKSELKVVTPVKVL